jgi:hypothetical protein
MSVLHIETLHASTYSCETLGQRRLIQRGKQSYVSERKINPEQQTTQLKASVHAGVHVYVLLQSAMQTSIRSWWSNILVRGRSADHVIMARQLRKPPPFRWIISTHMAYTCACMETSTVHNEVSYLHQGRGYFWTISDKASSTYSVGLRGY